MPDTILEEDHPRIISAKFGWDWLSNFRGEDIFQISSPCFFNFCWRSGRNRNIPFSKCINGFLWSYFKLRDLQLHVQPVLITTNVESLNSAYGEVYSIQHFVTKFVSDLRNVLILNTFPRSKCTNSEHISTVKMYQYWTHSHCQKYEYWTHSRCQNLLIIFERIPDVKMCWYWTHSRGQTVLVLDTLARPYIFTPFK